MMRRARFKAPDVSGARPITIFDAISRFNWPPSGAAKACEVTLGYSCNANCLFCYNPGDLRKRQGPDISFKKAAEALYLGRRQGCWVATFSGGEPSVYDELAGFLKAARKMGYTCIQVISNGLKLADMDCARRLVEAGGNLFKISIHSHKPAVHDRLVGVPGAFDKCMRAIDNLNSLGVKVSGNMAINRLNYRDIPGFTDLMLDRGLTGFCLMYGVYRGMMGANSELLKVRISTVVPYVRQALDLIRRARIPIETGFLAGFTPCLLPGCESIISEWKSVCSGDTLFLPDGRTLEQDPMHVSQKMKTPACARCVHSKLCDGIDAGYFKLFAGGEFVPLRKIPKAFPLDPIYI